MDHAYLMVPAQAYVGQFITSFKDFPPRQSAESFNLDEVLKKMQEGGESK
jgi:arylsulfatase